MTGKRRPAETFRLVFGSNFIDKTSAREGASVPLLVSGVEVFKIERGTDEQLLISTEVRDEKGELLVKVHRNSVVHARPDIQVRETHGQGRGTHRLETRRPNGQLVLELDVKSLSEVEVNGVFIVKGNRIEASKDGLRLGGLLLARSRMIDNGTAISIG